MPATHKINSRDLFDELHPEEEQPTSRVKVEKNTPLEEIVRNFEDLFSHRWAYYEVNGRGFVQRFYDRSIDALNRSVLKNLSPKTIEELSIVLQGYSNKNTWLFEHMKGLYLSALINASQGDNFSVHVNDSDIICIGYRNIKNINLNGNARDLVGARMSAGRLAVQGSYCGFGLGNNMAGGLIDVKGNASGQIACNMAGGKIVIRGDLERSGVLLPTIGPILDGEIYVYGDRMEFNTPCRGVAGSIYHKGKLMFKGVMK